VPAYPGFPGKEAAKWVSVSLSVFMHLGTSVEQPK